MSRSSTPEHLVESPIFEKNYNKTKFKILRSFKNFDLVKIETI